ncbi:MAG TPA: NnrS family protein [Terriglobales bacterium]
MATHNLHIASPNATLDARVEATRQREISLSRMVMTYIGTGLAFMLLPGTFLGVWNLLSISGKHAANSISPAWIQAHGQAQVFGWIGTFILGIGFYSIPKMRRTQAFAMWEAWVCWAMWTTGVLLRWVSTVYEWHWRVSLPISAALQLLAFALFFKTVSSHRPPAKGEEPAKFERWIFIVIAGTLGLLATLAANLVGSIHIALHSASPAFGAAFDQRFLVLMAWGFMVPFVWGFSARWLSTFVGLRTPCPRGLMLMIGVNTAGVLIAMFGFFRVAVLLFLASSVMSLLAIRVLFPATQPAKTQGIHSSFPYFVRLAYAWLIVAAALGIWAAFAANSDGIWGASRHALTVGFIATMVFAIGQRVLPAFSGMRVLYSPKLMGAALLVLTIGCLLRVSSEVLAYQEIVHWAWKWLPISAVCELTAVTLFAINMSATFLSKPPSRLVAIK